MEVTAYAITRTVDVALRRDASSASPRRSPTKASAF